MGLGSDEEIGARLSLKDRRLFSSEAKKAETSIDGLGSAAQRTNAKMAAADKEGMASFHSGVTRVGNAAKGALVVVGWVGAGLAVAAGAAGFFGLRTAASMEQAQIAFTTMLGSGQKAQAFLVDLQDFANKTPFEFPDLVTASQRLLAMGFTAQQIRPMLTNIGDAVAGLGGGKEMIDRVTTALGQMQAKTKVSAEEMMQLTEAGIPAWQFLADGLHKSVAQVMADSQKGAITAGQAIPVILDGMNKKFGGLMDKQSHTLSGLFSTMKDSLNMGLGRALAPVAAQLEYLLPGAIKVSGKAMDALGRRMDKVGKWFKRAAPIVRTFMIYFHNRDVEGMALTFDHLFNGGGKLAPVFTTLYNVARNLGRVFKTIIWPLFLQVARVALPLLFIGLQMASRAMNWMANNADIVNASVFGMLGAFTAFRTVTLILRMVTAAQWALNFAMDANPIMLMVILIGALIGVMVWLYFHSTRVRQAVDWLWQELQKLWNWASSHLQESYDYWKGIYDGAAHFIGATIGAIVNFREFLNNANIWDGLVSGAKTAINALISAWNALDVAINIDIPSWVPGPMAGMGLHISDIFPDIPMLGDGGTVTRGGSVMVGERGTPEILNLPPRASVQPLAAGTPTGSSLGGVTIGNINISGIDLLDSRRAADLVVARIKDNLARS